MPKLVRPVAKQQEQSSLAKDENKKKKEKAKPTAGVEDKAERIIVEPVKKEQNSSAPVTAGVKVKKEKPVVDTTPPVKMEKVGGSGEIEAVKKSKKKKKKMATEKVSGSEADQDKENLAEGIGEDGKVAGEEPAPVKEDIVKTVDTSQTEKCVEAFLKLLAVTKQEKKDLLEDEGAKKVFLQVSGIKLPRDSDKHIVKARLPHSPLPEGSDVLLIVKDLEKGLKVDHENTVLHFQSLLSDAGVANISEVISLRQLKVEYKQFEAKNQLCNRFEKVLVDDRILRLVPQLLGKPFYKKKKLPVAVNLTNKKLKEEVERCLNTSQLPLNNHGSCSMMAVGHSGMDKAQLVDNISASLRVLENRYPGGWINIRSVHVACGNTSLPLYISIRTAKQVGRVETAKGREQRREWVTDELSTVPGATVTVSPFGTVRIKRKADPEWDTLGIEKMDKAQEEKEEKENEAEEDKKKEEKKKKIDKKKSQKNKKAKKEESDSEDEMEDKETEYMRKVAEEEEEIERREEENRIKLGLLPQQAEEESEDGSEGDEVEDERPDDDVEAENLLSDESSDDETTEDLIMPQRSQEEVDQTVPIKMNKKKAHKMAEKADKKKKKEKQSKPGKGKGGHDKKQTKSPGVADKKKFAGGKKFNSKRKS